MKWKKPTHAHLKYSIHQFTQDLFIFQKREEKVESNWVVKKDITLTVVHNMYALIVSLTIRKENIYFSAFTRSLEITEKHRNDINTTFSLLTKLIVIQFQKVLQRRHNLICIYSLRRVVNLSEWLLWTFLFVFIDKKLAWIMVPHFLGIFRRKKCFILIVFWMIVLEVNLYCHNMTVYAPDKSTSVYYVASTEISL